jgi:NitT/TauT family transport system permease protein
MTDPTAVADAEELARLRRLRLERIARWLLPLALFVLLIAGWHWSVKAFEVPPYILPGPFDVLAKLA